MIIFHDSLSNPTLPFCLVLISAPVILAFICCYLCVSFCVIVCLSFFFTGFLSWDICILLSFLFSPGWRKTSSLPSLRGFLIPLLLKLILLWNYLLFVLLCITFLSLYWLQVPQGKKNVLPTVICITTWRHILQIETHRAKGENQTTVLAALEKNM